MEYLERNDQQGYVAYSEEEQTTHNLPPTHSIEAFTLFASEVLTDYNRAQTVFDELDNAYMDGGLMGDQHQAYQAAQTGLDAVSALFRKIRWVQAEITRAETAKLHGWLNLEFPRDDPDFPNN